MNDEVKQPRRGRGLGKKPSMQYIGIRVSREVYDFYNSFPSRSKAVRQALELFIQQHKETEK